MSSCGSATACSRAPGARGYGGTTAGPGSVTASDDPAVVLCQFCVVIKAPWGTMPTVCTLS